MGESLHVIAALGIHKSELQHPRLGRCPLVQQHARLEYWYLTSAAGPQQG